MSTVIVDDVQYVTSNGVDQIQRPNGVAVTHQPRPSYAYINNQTMQNPSQYQTGPAVIYQNGQSIPVLIVIKSSNRHLQLARDLNNVHDYTVWSICNMFLCCIVLGVYALYMPKKPKAKKHMGDLQGARQALKGKMTFRTTLYEHPVT